jgi:hypothetical protein
MLMKQKKTYRAVQFWITAAMGAVKKRTADDQTDPCCRDAFDYE